MVARALLSATPMLARDNPPNSYGTSSDDRIIYSGRTILGFFWAHCRNSPSNQSLNHPAHLEISSAVRSPMGVLLVGVSPLRLFARAHGCARNIHDRPHVGIPLLINLLTIPLTSKSRRP
jgi:hypothetical protein